MVPVFSATSSDLGDSSALAELQLLPDHELMSLWEQTQLAMDALEVHGGSARTAHTYEYAVLMEMQRRQAARPSYILFGMGEESPVHDRSRTQARREVPAKA